MEGDTYYESDEGVPQGGLLSPILANIYLHYISDLWFVRKVRERLKGYAGMVRYADDFIVCFQAEKEAKVFRDMLRQRLGKFELRIAENKSRIIEFGRYVWERAQKTDEKVETFDFLGFTHYCDKTILGKLGRKTAVDRVRRIEETINEWLKGLAVKLVGLYRYYGISGNMRSLKRIFWLVVRLVYRWINRRSQEL